MASPTWAWVTYDLWPGRERLQPWRMAAAWATEAARRGARPVVVNLSRRPGLAQLGPAEVTPSMRGMRPAILWVQLSPRSRRLDLGPAWGPRVAVVPGPIAPLRRARGWRARLDSALAPLFARRLAAFDRVLVFTRRQADALRRAGCPVPIDVWPPSVPARVAPPPGPVARRFLYLGPDRPERGLEVLRRAFRRAEWALPGLELAALVRRDPQAGASAAEIDAAIARADVVVVPTLWAESDAPVVPLEARAAGRPLIVTDVDGLPELAGAGAVVVPPGNVRALEEAMVRLATDSAEFARLTAAITPPPSVPLPVPPARPPRALILSGPDGAGKSTLLAALPWQARTNWMRMPYYLTRALHATGRLFGGTRVSGGHRYHDFRRVPWLREVYPWIQLIDLVVAHALGRADLYDRHWPDVLVDLVLKTGRRGLLASWGGCAQRLFGSIPAAVLSAPRETLLARRPILALDPQLGERLALYAEVARRFDLPVLDGREPVARLVEALYAGPAPATTSPIQ